MAVLAVNDLKKSFGDLEVLRGISFSLEKGEVLSVIGSSGSGKTTLLRCLNFLEQPDSGQFSVNGELLYDGNVEMNDAELRHKRLKFGLVFQSFNLFPQYTVLKNVTLARELQAKETARKTDTLSASIAQINQEARDLLTRVGLGDKLSAYPCQLSGGQQQRVAIARALALKPDILCFDEPTSALDPELTGEVLKVIRSLKSSDRTMIIVTHEMEFAKNVSDKIMFMADGEIVEMGPPSQLFGDNAKEKTRAFLQNTYTTQV